MGSVTAVDTEHSSSPFQEKKSTGLRAEPGEAQTSFWARSNEATHEA